MYYLNTVSISTLNKLFKLLNSFQVTLSPRADCFTVEEPYGEYMVQYFVLNNVLNNK